MDGKQFYSNSSTSARYNTSTSAATSTASNTTAGAKKSRAKDCTYCSKNNDELNFCRSCRLRAHQKCFQNNFGVMREGYKNKVVICAQCRHCEMCSDKKGELFFCKRCSSCFHQKCDSNLNKISKPQLGKWQCSFCDTLDGLVGDTLSEESRRKEINRRKLLAMRKRLRKSDYVLEDGLCSIQQVVKKAVKKHKKDNQSNEDDKNEIDLSEDELINSKHILNESQNLDIWTNDEAIDFNKLEDFLKRERKLNNILAKHIKDDKKYFVLVKVFIDQLKDEKFNCKKSNFLKLLNSDFFKKSFFESNSLHGLTKSSTFLEACTKCFEKCIQNDYWKCPNESEPDFDHNVIKEESNQMVVEESKSNKESIEKDTLELECKEEFLVNENPIETDMKIKNESSDSKELVIANKNQSSEPDKTIEVEIADQNKEEPILENNKMEIEEVKEVINENDLKNYDHNDKLVVIEQNTEIETKLDDKSAKVTDSANDESLNETHDLICEETIDDNIDEEKNNLDEGHFVEIKSKETNAFDKNELTNKLNELINNKPLEKSKNETIKKGRRSKSISPKSISPKSSTSPKSISPQPSTSKEGSNGKLNSTLDIKPSSNNLADKLFKKACKYNLNLLEPKFWTIQDVSTYIKQIGFDSAAECFKKKSVDGKALLNLSRQQVLKNFNIRLGPAIKLYAYIYDIQVKNRCNIIFD